MGGGVTHVHTDAEGERGRGIAMEIKEESERERYREIEREMSQINQAFFLHYERCFNAPFCPMRSLRRGEGHPGSEGYQ